MNLGKIGILLVIIFICFLVNANVAITGDVVGTGKAVLDNFSISVSVVNFPALTIVSPKNETYIRNRIFLDYLVDYSNSVWYNVDNGVNISISSPSEIFLNAGFHVINLYAENIYGISVKNVSFSVDLFLLDVVYDDYSGVGSGLSTDFDSYSFEELHNLSGVILERVDFGKIEFLENINVIDDSNSSDGVVDLDSNVLMSKARIRLSVTALPNFNVSSFVSFYNLDMVSPRVMKDGSVCLPNVCSNKSYVGGVLSFNTVEMGDFFVVETYVPPSSNGGGSSGGGGGKSLVDSYEGEVDRGILSVNRDKFSVSVRQGDIETQEIVVSNKGDKKISFDVVSEGFGDLIFLNDYDDVVLEPGESKSIYVDISVGENIVVDNYLGRLRFLGKDISRDVLVSVFVESMFGIFDVDVSLGDSDDVVFLGEFLDVSINISNLGKLERRNVIISYFLKNSDGDVVFLEEEIGVIDASLSLVKKFRIPENFIEDDYVLYTNIEYEGRVTGGSVWFKVAEKSDYGFLVWLVLGLVILIILIVIFKKKGKKKSRVR